MRNGRTPKIVPPAQHLRPRATAEGEALVTVGEDLDAGLVRALELDMELVRLRIQARGRAEGAREEEETEDGLGGGIRVGGLVLVQIACRGEDKVRFAIGLGEALLALHHAIVHGLDGRIVSARPLDMVNLAQGRVGLEQMVRTGGKGDPLLLGRDGRHGGSHVLPRLLNGDRGPRLPFVKGGPGRLDGANDALLEMGRVGLHDDDGFLKVVLLVDLPTELAHDVLVVHVRILTDGDLHRRVLGDGDGLGQVGNGLDGQLTLFGDGDGKLASILLDVADVRLDLRLELDEVLNDGRIDGATQGRMRIRHSPCAIPQFVINIL